MPERITVPLSALEADEPETITVPLSELGAAPTPRGPITPGNIDLYNRPPVANPDGTSSTVRSMSFEQDGKEILIPTVVGGKVVSENDAIAHYRKTGEHLGIFPDSDSATAYAEQLHNDYAAGKYIKRLPVVPMVPPLVGQAPPARPELPVDAATAAYRRITPSVTQIEPAPPLSEFAKVPIISGPAVGIAQAAQGLRNLAKAAASTTLPPALPPPQTGAEAFARSTPAVTQTQREAQPLSNETMAAGSDVLEGAFKILEPTFVVAGIAAPFAMLSSLVSAYGASKATEMLSRQVGLNDEQTRLLSNIAGAVAASVVPGAVNTGIKDAAAWGRERTAAREAQRSWPIDVKTGKRVPPGAGDVIDTNAVRKPIAELPPIDTAIEKVAPEPLAPPPPPNVPPPAPVDFAPEPPPPAPAAPSGETITVPVEQLQEFQPEAEVAPAIEKAPIKADTYKFSSTQVNLPEDLAQKVKAWGAEIPETHLAGDGRETEPHITVKYGLHTNDVEEVRKLLADEPPITVALGKTSSFPPSDSSDGAATIKIDVDSPDLHRLNKKIADALEHTDTFPDYKPHATIAYVKPTKAPIYVGHTKFVGQRATIDRIRFSAKDGSQVDVMLTGQPKEKPVTLVSKSLQTGRVTEQTLPATTKPATPAAAPPPAQEGLPSGAIVGSTFKAEGRLWRIKQLAVYGKGTQLEQVDTTGPDKSRVSSRWVSDSELRTLWHQDDAPTPTRKAMTRGGYTLSDVVFEKGKVATTIEPDKDGGFSIRTFNGAQLVEEGTGGQTREEALVQAKKSFDYNVREAEHRARTPKRLGGTKEEPASETLTSPGAERSVETDGRQPESDHPAPVGGQPPEAVPAAAGDGATPAVSGRSGTPRAGRGGARDSERPPPGPSAGTEPTGVATPQRGGQPKPERPTSLARPTKTGRDYRITDADDLGRRWSESDRIESNLAALKLLKTLDKEGRPATPAEQKILVRYVGWGGLPNVFRGYGELAHVGKTLEDLLTESEYESARGSTLNAHYTSPDIIGSVYDAVKRLGFAGGRVLEPAAGAGHFFGLMPPPMAARSQFAGVELDPVTARIAQQLYQSAQIQAKGFEKATLPDNFFDLVISNVPFGKYGVHDPAFTGRPKALTSAIHNYFFAKALDKVRPGGLVAFITSRYTMDSQANAVRKYLAVQAELLGAIRLPETAFKANANTEVVTDILFLRKRETPRPAGENDAWVNTGTLNIGSVTKHVNQYFIDHPEMVLGTHAVTRGMYGPDELTVQAKDGSTLTEQFATAIKKLPKNAVAPPDAPSSTTPTIDELIPAPDHVKENGYAVQGGKLFVREKGKLKPVTLPAATAARVTSALTVRDRLRETMRAMLDPDATDAAVRSHQQQLTKAYDTFVKKHGFLSTRQNIGALGDDPDKPLLLALEHWDVDTQTAKKAAIFTKRTLSPQRPVTSADSPKGAMLVSLNELGRVDFARMAELTGETEATLQDELRGVVFLNPSGAWETSEEYLSGNVRQKLAEAEAAAALDKRYSENVEALKAVQPADLGPKDIDVRLGASWVPAEDVRDFVAHLLDLQPYQAKYLQVRYIPPLAAWTIKSDDYRIGHTVAASAKWGTQRMPALELLEQALNLKQPTIKDKASDGTETVNQQETLAAREKLQAIKDEFKQWLWRDDARATRLAQSYNTQFNNLRMREYDGSHLTLPGMSTHIQLRPHQKNSIWRVLQSGNTGFGHVVGAGKTYAMAASMMESRRLGLAKKPMLVAKNGTVEQIASDFQRLYPAARLLVTNKDDFAADKRKKLVSRIATGDWDAVILAHSSFGKIPISDEAFETFLQKQLDELEEYLTEAREAEGKRGPTVKQIERSKKTLEAKLEARRNAETKDRTLTFEETGVDMLVVDEADLFKNLFFPTKMTRVAGLPNTESDRSFDMFLKTQHVQRVTNGRGVVFATATPISNSMAEVFTMQRYLQLPALEAAGLAHFDAWAQQFGETVQALELAPEGSGYRSRTRFARFSNLPELVAMFRQVWDIKLIDDLPDVKALLPKLSGGKPIVVAVPASEELKVFVKQLAERAEAIRGGRVRPDEDNMLKITGEGRKAALDMRLLLGPGYPADPEGKIARAAQNIHADWKAAQADKGTQLVFSDIGTPNSGDRFDVYNALKTALIEQGIPAEQIAFIHDYDTEAKLLKVYRQVNKGEIRVLMGSTEKLGAGVNVQERLVAQHHLDAPWRPRDVEQRDGRIVRQGNALQQKDPDFAVKVYRYVTEGSFDAYSWQTLETKKRFIDQVMNGKVTQRSAEDVEGGALTYAEVKALASGNPAVLEKVKADTDVRKYSMLKSAHDDQQWRFRAEKKNLPERIIAGKHTIARLDSLIAAREIPKDFTIRIGTTDYTEHKAAGEALLAAIKTIRIPDGVVPVGEYAHLTLSIARRPGIGNQVSTVAMLHGGEGGVSRDISSEDPVGLVRSITHFAETVPETSRNGHRIELERNEQRLKEIAVAVDAPFEHQAALAEALRKQASLEKLLDLDSKGQQAQGAAVEEGTETAEKPTAGGGDASIGSYAEGSFGSPEPARTASAPRVPRGPQAPTAGPQTIRPAQFPEMVDLARALQGVPGIVKGFRRLGQMGVFKGEHGIRLAAGLFGKGQEYQLAATLAHEIGHLVDYLPHKTLKRGNLLGRLLSLQRFMKWKFTAPDGHTIRFGPIKTELMNLSKYWRPWNRDEASDSFRKYRDSSKELFADAISVLLNNPGLLETRAPTFYKEFFAALDAKPEVRDAYFALQEVLAGTPEELVARRRAGVRRMLEEGDVAAIELEKQRQAELAERNKNLWFRLKTQLVDKNYAVIDRVAALVKQGVRLPDDENPVYLLEERNYLGGKLKGFTERHFVPVFHAIENAEIHWNAFGEALFYERIIAGDRSEVANPRGLSAADAKDAYDSLQIELGADKRKVLKQAITDFRTAVKAVAQQAFDEGLYTPELYAQMQANPAYVTFQVIEHLENAVTSRVYRQVGTLKDIVNPADATILKTLVTIRAIEHNKVKRTTAEFLGKHFPTDIAPAKTIYTGKGHKPIASKDKHQHLLMYYRGGKLVGHYVDQYIADSLENASIGQNLAVVSLLRRINSGIFRPLFTTFNLGFQSFNFLRDFLRFWKNVPGMGMTKALARYAKAVPFAKARAFGHPSTDVLDAEEAHLISVTFNDLINGREVADTQIEDILRRTGVGAFQPHKRSPWIKPFTFVLDTIKELGDFIETLPKAAAIYEYKGAGSIADIPASTRSFIRRKVGSPDFLAGGTAKPLTNEVFLFSNAITQALRSDYEVATEPNTRAGFWWKTVAVNLVPKVLMFAAITGLLGETLRRLYSRTTEYDRTNYLVVAVGDDAKGNTIYLRVPQDDSGRLISGVFWKLLQLGRGDASVLKTVSQVLDYTAGQFPSVSPTVSALQATGQYVAGQNPYDAFRGRNVFSDDEWKARDVRTAKKFIGWEFQQLGGGIVWKFYPGETAPRQLTKGQRILELPVVSNIAGRFVRITNYGETEALRGVQGQVQQTEARARMTEREAIDDALTTYLALPKSEQTPRRRAEVAVEVAERLYPDKVERAERLPTLRTKLRIGALRGEADPLVDAVMGATSADQKVALIQGARKTMSPKAFNDWLMLAAREGVISKDVIGQVRRTAREPANVVP